MVHIGNGYKKYGHKNNYGHKNMVHIIIFFILA